MPWQQRASLKGNTAKIIMTIIVTSLLKQFSSVMKTVHGELCF
jgi:hypothetical protein